MIRPGFSAGGDEVNSVKIVGIALIAAGILGLVYGGFSYTKTDPRGEDRLARAVGEGQGDRQRPGLGRRRRDRGWRDRAAGAQEELAATPQRLPSLMMSEIATKVLASCARRH